MDGAWGRAPAGYVPKTSFWYKELMGVEVYANSGDGNGPQPNLTRPRPEIIDPYYISALKARWSVVRSQMSSELKPYIDATDARFKRVTGFGDQPISIMGDRADLKNVVDDMVNEIDIAFGEY